MSAGVRQAVEEHVGGVVGEDGRGDGAEGKNRRLSDDHLRRIARDEGDGVAPLHAEREQTSRDRAPPLVESAPAQFPPLPGRRAKAHRRPLRIDRRARREHLAQQAKGDLGERCFAAHLFGERRDSRGVGHCGYFLAAACFSRNSLIICSCVERGTGWYLANSMENSPLPCVAERRSVE